MSRFFVSVFIGLLPFSLIPELMKEGALAFWGSIPIATLIGLLFTIMEDLGDYNKNPCTGMPNAIPMMSISRALAINQPEEVDINEILYQPTKQKL